MEQVPSFVVGDVVLTQSVSQLLCGKTNNVVSEQV